MALACVHVDTVGNIWIFPTLSNMGPTGSIPRSPNGRLRHRSFCGYYVLLFHCIASVSSFLGHRFFSCLHFILRSLPVTIDGVRIRCPVQDGKGTAESSGRFLMGATTIERIGIQVVWLSRLITGKLWSQTSEMEKTLYVPDTFRNKRFCLQNVMSDGLAGQWRSYERRSRGCTCRC